MDNVIEIIKIVGAFAGPILGALALLLQRASENRQAKASSETTIAGEAREWATDFREEMDKLRSQSLQAQEEALKARLANIEVQSAVHELKMRVQSLTSENTILKDNYESLKKDNERLGVELATVRSENDKLGKEVITLRGENSALRLTVEQQASQIKELQNGKEHDV